PLQKYAQVLTKTTAEAKTRISQASRGFEKVVKLFGGACKSSQDKLYPEGDYIFGKNRKIIIKLQKRLEIDDDDSHLDSQWADNNRLKKTYLGLSTIRFK
ncbi:hypothetical protein TNIN_284121, partial [Trichonephila inaurata madagascariensis]